MNVTVYLFGKLGGSYTQYPDDYARDVFSKYENNIKSPAQLMIHRHDALIYYGYLRQLSEHGKYIGIAFVFNGAMCTDITALCKLCEENITNWVVNGDILEFDDNGDIISKVDKLYKTVSEFKRLSESLSAQIVNVKLPFQKLPPVNYAVSTSAIKTFNIEENSETINTALNQYSNIYIYSDSTSETLAGYSDKLRRLSKENSDLRAENEKVFREKKNTTIVTILSFIVAAVVIAIIVFVNRSSEQKRQINQLTTENQHLYLNIEELQRDIIVLEQNFTSTRNTLKEVTNHLNQLQQDSTRLITENTQLSYDLTTANQNIDAYRKTIEQKDKQIKEKDQKISSLQSQLSKQSISTNTSPITISTVSIASIQRSGNTANDFGYTIYSSSSYYIKVKMTYSSNSGGYKNFTIKLYGPSPSRSGYIYYDSESENVYLYSSSSSYQYTFSKVLGKNGNKLPAGNYYVDICYDYKVLKTHYFTIK